MKRLNYLAFIVLVMMGQNGFASTNHLTALTDGELSAETGQALFNLSYIAPTDTSNLMNGKTIAGDPVGKVGFYKLGMEGELELNSNIKSLQLGCGGRNGPDGCDIEINNLSLSGLPDGGTHNNLGVATPNGGYDANGNPVYANGRASTSAKLVNPFLEFAIKDPDKASTREFLGFRVSAEKIYGLLTAGLENLNYASNDGIQSLSGFMRIAATSGSVTTKETLFGQTADQALGASATSGPYSDPNQKPNMIVNLLGEHKRIFKSNPGASDNQGISVPSIENINFNTPAFQVNGVRNTNAVVKNIGLTMASIPMGKVSAGMVNGVQQFTSVGAKNQLYVTYDPILGLAKDAKFQMANGSDVRNLHLSIDFNQSLSMIHNVVLNGNGGYLSLQKQQMLWPGAYVTENTGVTEINNMTKSDVAQPGWWMSFKDEVQLGKLQASEPVDISSSLPQVAQLTSKFLQDNPVMISGGEGLQALVGNPIVKLLNIDLETYTNPVSGGTPAKVVMQNLQLANQNVVSNCYGSLKFC